MAFRRRRDPSPAPARPPDTISELEALLRPAGYVIRELRRCRACERTFYGVEAFAAHRAGSYRDRRCLDEVQLQAVGLKRDEVCGWPCWRLVRS